MKNGVERAKFLRAAQREDFFEESQMCDRDYAHICVFASDPTPLENLKSLNTQARSSSRLSPSLAYPPLHSSCTITASLSLPLNSNVSTHAPTHASIVLLSLSSPQRLTPSTNPLAFRCQKLVGSHIHSTRWQVTQPEAQIDGTGPFQASHRINPHSSIDGVPSCWVPPCGFGSFTVLSRMVLFCS